MYLVLLGPPGSGKGTQAERLKEQLGLPHVASGDLFRENIENETELGLLAKGFIDRGQLVPDDVTIAGNVYDLLQDVAAVSQETQWVYCFFSLPYILLPDVNVVAKE